MTILYCVTIQNKGCQFLKKPLPNIFVFEKFTSTDTNSTIWSQLHEYQMIRIICCNSVTQPLISVKDLET